MIFISKSEVEKWPILGWVGARYGTIYLRRGEADRGAIRDALGVLAAQQVLTIFPEGHRNKGHGLLPAQPGISLLASRGRALIWPVAIDGTHRIFKDPRPRVTVRAGEPFDPRALIGSDGIAARDHQGLADEVMRRIAALLPRDRRGAYG
jgi:1-acyl-sn-glycerol-3-phosphate acyltransferase